MASIGTRPHVGIGAVPALRLTIRVMSAPVRGELDDHDLAPYCNGNSVLPTLRLFVGLRSKKVDNKVQQSTAISLGSDEGVLATAEISATGLVRPSFAHAIFDETTKRLVSLIGPATKKGFVEAGTVVSIRAIDGCQALSISASQARGMGYQVKDDNPERLPLKVFALECTFLCRLSIAAQDDASAALDDSTELAALRSLIREHATQLRAGEGAKVARLTVGGVNAPMPLLTTTPA